MNFSITLLHQGHKVDPKYNRYHIFSELSFLAKCYDEIKYLKRDEYDLGFEVVEDIFELERVYNNTASELLKCADQILKYLNTSLYVNASSL